MITEWKLVSESLVNDVNKCKRAVVIYPHTSYWDFVVMLLVFLSQPDLHKNTWCVVNEGIYKKFPRCLHIIGCIPATAKEKTKAGFIADTVCRFKDSDKYKIVISPEGTIKKCKWRSGYYWLAKELGCPILIFGANYSTHRIDYNGIFEITTTYEKLELELQEKFKKIVPLYPECSEVDITLPYDPPSVVGMITLTAFLTPLPTLWYLFYIAPISGIILTFCTFVSVIYHYNGEILLRQTEPTVIKIGIFTYFITLIIKNLIKFDEISIFLWSGVYITYHLGSGRKLTCHRSSDYNKYHVWFHIFSGLATVYFLI